MLMLSDEEVAERLSIPVESAPCYFPDPQAMVQSMHLSHGNFFELPNVVKQVSRLDLTLIPYEYD